MANVPESQRSGSSPNLWIRTKSLNPNPTCGIDHDHQRAGNGCWRPVSIAGKDVANHSEDLGGSSVVGPEALCQLLPNKFPVYNMGLQHVLRIAVHFSHVGCSLQRKKAWNQAIITSILILTVNKNTPKLSSYLSSKGELFHIPFREMGLSRTFANTINVSLCCVIMFCQPKTYPRVLRGISWTTANPFANPFALLSRAPFAFSTTHELPRI